MSVKEREDEPSINALAIKIASSGKQAEDANGCSSHVATSPNLTESSPYGSPSLVSPTSSAFVSASQSPYISPRALISADPPQPSSPLVSCRAAGSQLEDIPSSSYTPPTDQYEFSDDPDEHHNTNLKFIACVVPDPAPPRISFSFPVPSRISFAKSPLSPSPSASSNPKLTTCDVYIGFHGQNPNLLRFCKWLKSDLDLQGIDCFLADRAKYSDCQSHDIADRVICSAAFGLVVVTNCSFLNHLSMEEIRFFAQKKNLIPIFFDTGPAELQLLIPNLVKRNSMDKERKQVIDGLVKFHEFKLEASNCNWRSCISKATAILRARLGRKSTADHKDIEGFESLPFPRNAYFVGREKEIMAIESLFFGLGNCVEQDHSVPVIKGDASGQSEGLADEENESESSRGGGRYISLEIGKSKEPTSELWNTESGKNSFKRSKNKKSKSGNCKRLGSSVICINGVSGIGKSELALEFAYRYYQSYKMVLWVGGEAQYLRQNILNLSISLGLDVSADSVMERGRIRSFEEQELEAFKRIKRELFGDIPYLIIIDNLESEEELWEGKDLNDLIPRNSGGGTHVIITTGLSKVKNYDTIQLPPLPLPDAVALIRGRKKKDYQPDEIELLRQFNEKLGGLSFGLWLIGSLLSELAIGPAALLEAINQVPLEEIQGTTLAHIKTNPFVTKTLNFCFGMLEKENILATRMLLVSGWLVPSPISASLLVTAARNIPHAGNRLKWTTFLGLISSCLSISQPYWKTEEDSAIMLLVKMGLARRANKQEGYWIHFHPITQAFTKTKGCLQYAQAAVRGVRRISNIHDHDHVSSAHLWASAFLVFGFKTEPPLVELKANELVLYVKRTALPLAIQAFTTFSRCNSALELLKVCTNALEEVEKSFVSQIQDWSHESICWRRKRSHKVDEYVWQDVTLLKATLLETRAKLLARGGHIDSAKELCRTCVSIRTVMLGHNHAHTLAAQDTLAGLVRIRCKI